MERDNEEKMEKKDKKVLEKKSWLKIGKLGGNKGLEDYRDKYLGDPQTLCG